MHAIDRQCESEPTPSSAPDPGLIRPLRHTHRSTDTTRRSGETPVELIAERQAFVLAVIAEILDAVDLERSLDALVGALQQGLAAERVAVALMENKESLELRAISQQAIIDTASSEARLLINVMHECLEHESLVCFPGDDIELGVLVAHRELASRHKSMSLVSVPLYQDSEPVAVLLIERHEHTPFSDDVLELLEQIALLAAPPLRLHQLAERSLPARTKDSLGKLVQRRTENRENRKQSVLGSI